MSKLAVLNPLTAKEIMWAHGFQRNTPKLKLTVAPLSEQGEVMGKPREINCSVTEINYEGFRKSNETEMPVKLQEEGSEKIYQALINTKQTKGVFGTMLAE